MCVLYMPSPSLALRCLCLCVSILGRFRTFRTRLGIHPQFVVELEALCEKVRYCRLTFWDVAVDLELPVGTHVVNGVELQ